MNHNHLDDEGKALLRWADENVLVFDTPRQITLFDLQADSTRYKGSFRIKLDETLLDDTRLKHPFTFSLGDNGRPSWGSPMFCSPLGAPISIPAVTLTEATEQAIQIVLERLLPRMRPLGLNRDIDVILTYGSSVEDRMLDLTNYERCFAELVGSQHTLILAE